MILSRCIALWVGGLVAKLAPQTPAGRACQEWLVSRPAAWLSRLTLRSAVSLVISGAVLGVAVAYLAPVLSGEAALLLAGDALAYVEVLSAVVLVAIRSSRATSAVRKLVGSAVRVGASACTRLVSPRQKRAATRRPRAPAAQDDGEPVWAMV